MSEKVYLLILRTGVYISLFSVFLVFKNLLFPFITSKQISFNILIEILLVFWIAFIVKYPQYRPSWSYISFGLVAFMFAITLSSFFGVDFNLSFWGDVERMLGVFHILHFLAFYFIIITVMRKWEDWKIFLIVSTVFAVIVSLMGIGEDANPYSTIGNTAYVSGYLIFNIYFCLLLFFKEKNKNLRWLYLLPLPIYYLEFDAANTTGALVGLGFSIIVMFFLYGVFSKDRRFKFATLGIFLFLAIFSGLAWVNKESDWVKNNSLLSPIRGINLQKNTFQTRLISWRAAIKDFPNHPILGTGHGNYAIIFDKHFEPTFYDYTRSETYFDRAHNNVIDIASTSGIVGLLTYLSIFVAAAYYMIQGYRKDYFNIHEFVMLASLLIAYFVQNLAVFDSLVTYIGLMMTLGIIFWIYDQGEKSNLDMIKEKGGEAIRAVSNADELKNKETYTLLGAGAVIFIIMWQFNILPYKMLDLTIEGQRAWAAGNAQATVEIYKDALSYDTVLDRDSRNSLVRSFVSNPAKFNDFPVDQRLAVADYMISLAQANVDYNKHDSLNQMMLAQAYEVASKLAKEIEPAKFEYYSNGALEAINASIDASPERIPIYYQKAQIFLTRGEQDKAIETLRYAYSLNEQYYDSACHLGRTLLFTNTDEDEGYEYIAKCIAMNGFQYLGSDAQLRGFVEIYKERGDTETVINLYEQLAKKPTNQNDIIELAKLYAEEGMTDKAIETAQRISELYPNMESYVQDFISELE